MKKSNLWMLGSFVAVCLTLSGVAFADTVSGTVKTLDPTTSSLEVSQANAAGDVKVSFDSATTYEGIVTSAELKTGNEVTIEATKDESGNLKASSIKVTSMEAPAVPEAPVQP